MRIIYFLGSSPIIFNTWEEFHNYIHRDESRNVEEDDGKIRYKGQEEE